VENIGGVMAEKEPAEWVERFLAADPQDAGCDETMAVMHVYADMRADGLDPEARFPGVAAHLAACQSCADEGRGLLEAVLDDALSVRTLREHEFDNHGRAKMTLECSRERR
jgi:hypothetical protein